MTDKPENTALPVERKNLPPSREAVAMRHFADIDKRAVGAIHDRYGEFIPTERLKSLATMPTKFEGDREFKNAFRAETGHNAPDNLAGFTEPDSAAHVCVKNISTVPDVVLHERLHQLASPEAKRVLGHDLYEGMTEDLAIEVLGKEPHPGDLTGYPAERARAHKLRTLLGSEAVCRAYFQGDVKQLRAAVDRVLAERPLASAQDKIKKLPSLE